VTDALGHNQTTVYDNVGNVLSIADGLNNLKTYGYDAKNRRVSTIDAKGGITSTNYDAIGNVTKITDSVGNALHLRSPRPNADRNESAWI
jgi:YD repeat-containing protein